MRQSVYRNTFEAQDEFGTLKLESRIPRRSPARLMDAYVTVTAA